MTDITEGSAGYQAAHPLVARLTRLRSRVRAIVGIYGVGVLLLTTVSTFFVLALADYFFHIPLAARLTLLILTIIGIAVLAWRILILPLSTRLTDTFLASRVENQNPQLSDELMSAVAFIHSRAATTNAFAARHIDLAAQRTDSIRFEDAVNFRRAGKSVGIAGLAVVIVAILGLANPAMARIAFARWFMASTVAWPHTAHVTFVWTDSQGTTTTIPPKVRPLGEKLTIRAKVDQGSVPRVWLTSWTDKTGSDRQLMYFQKDQSTGSHFIFVSSLEPDGHQLSLRVVAGDDTEEPIVEIKLAPRPVITELQAMILAPAYAKDVKDPTKPAPGTLVNLLSQSGRATKGATINLRVKATKPFKINGNGEPVIDFLDLNDNQPLALAASRRLISAAEAEISFVADKTLQARLLMTDTDDFASRGGGTASIEVVPDAMPAIVITDPRRSVQRAPNGIVELTIQATDDWGFNGLKLRADKFDAKEGDPAAFEAPLTWQELTADAAVGNTTGKTRYTWDLTPLDLQAGTRLTFYGMVQDNFNLDGKTHDWVKSSPLSLEIRSTNDIQETERKELSELNDRIRALKLQQEQTRAQTNSLRQISDNSNQLSDEQRQQLANLAQQQTQEAAAANAVQARADQIADELRQNKLQEGELGKIAQQVSQGMNQVGQQNMPRAASNLSQAQESKGSPNNSAAQQSSQSMTGATQQQDQAIAKMDELIKQLAATGDFESLRQETGKILQQQQDLIKATQQLAPKVAGTPHDSLPQNLKDQEDSIAKQQRDLGDKTADLLDRMEKAAQPLAQSDQASSQSLQNAAKVGKDAQVSSKQQSAASNLAGTPGDSKSPGSQTNDANNNQQAAQQGLQDMMDQLNQNDLRKLEQLARDIRKLIEDVQKLHDDQVALNKETDAAGAQAAAAAIGKLADRQGTLQQNTIVIQKKAENTPRVAQAAAFIGEASDHMITAASALFSSKQPDSLKPQLDAISSLEQALEELKKADAAVEPDVKNKQLAEFIKQYEAIKKDQTAIKETTNSLEAKRLTSDDKELDRLDGKKVAELGKTQGGLVDQISALSKDERLGQVAVVVWMNGEVADAMSASKSHLEKQQLGKPTATAQQNAIDRLQLIIDALKEEQNKPSEFNNDGGGGGGGGQQPLVPPVAQLKLLKAMQLVVNNQTQSIDGDLKAAASDADRNDLQTQAQQLGGKETKIRGMASDIVDQLLHTPRPPAGGAAPGGAPTSQPAPR